MIDPTSRQDSIASTSSESKLLERFQSLTSKILNFSNRGVLKREFLKETCLAVLDFCKCDQVTIWVKKDQGYYSGVATKAQPPRFNFDSVPHVAPDRKVLPSLRDRSELGSLCDDVFAGEIAPGSSFFTERGSFWMEDCLNPVSFVSRTSNLARHYKLDTVESICSLAIIPITVANESIGILLLVSNNKGAFSPSDIQLFEVFSESLGITLLNERAQAALRERIKELTCLYGIAQIVEKPELSLDEVMRKVVELLPPAWQYPEVVSARIILSAKSYETPGFIEGHQKQSAELLLNGQKQGTIEVVYREEKPPADEGPFLTEERSLIEAVAAQVGLIVERKLAEQEKIRLEEQLRHADRLATIGQLTAGVAHELNEPLSNILGFAQLAKKDSRLPEQVSKDLEKIITASLHAREVIKKLMLFSRQMPTKMVQVNLNNLVEQGLYFLASRCAKSEIKLEKVLSPEIPEILADPSQLYQVLVNLVVNSIQALPQGGRITIRTEAGNGHVLLSVEDTGVGMSPEIVSKIFLPFFTTKDVYEGTGLGLAVVHGIVTSHGGTIQVESEVGKGSKFNISLPVNISLKEREGG